MRKLISIFLLLTVSINYGYGQSDYKKFRYRILASVGPNISLGTRFDNGSTNLVTPDNLTGAHSLDPLISVLFGFPKQQLPYPQNLARKLDYSIFFETILSDQFSLSTGFKIGARGYRLNSNATSSYIISYRNLSIPLFFTNTYDKWRFWTWRQHLGMDINFAKSTPENTPTVFTIKSNPIWYPTLYMGTELGYFTKPGPFIFHAGFHLGFYNIIDHLYLATDLYNGNYVINKGTHISLSVKWNFGDKEKRYNETPKPNSDVYVDLFYRETKDPIIQKVTNNKLKICFKDDQTFDGDSIALLFNEEYILKDQLLTQSENCIEIELQNNKENLLIIHALNLGKIPPNTYEISVYDGDNKYIIKLKSDLSKSASIKFERN